MLELVGMSGVIPALAAGITLWLVRWILPAEMHSRYGLTLGAGVGLLVGYGLLPAWAPWQPTTYWHWLPYLGLAAAGVGSLTLASGIHWAERWIAALLLAGLSAWYLVPTWGQLEPTRVWHVTVLAAYMAALIACLAPLSRQMAADRWLAYLGTSAFVSAVTTAIAVSLRFGQVGTILAASLLGLAAIAWLSPATIQPIRSQTIVPWYAILVGGMAYVAYVNPSPRLPGFIFMPLAPVALYLCHKGPLSHRMPRQGWCGLLVEWSVLLVPLIVSAAWVLVTTSL
jgi:hypothetical protein